MFATGYDAMTGSLLKIDVRGRQGLALNQLDLYSFSRQGYSDTFNATFFVGAAIGYLLITLPLIRIVNVVEKRLRSGLVGIAGAST